VFLYGLAPRLRGLCAFRNTRTTAGVFLYGLAPRLPARALQAAPLSSGLARIYWVVMRCLLLASLALFVYLSIPQPLTAQTPAVWESAPEWPTVQRIEQDLVLVKQQLERLARKEPVILFLTTMTILTGFLTALFSALNRSWTPTATKICAALVATVTAAQATFFRIDYFTCSSVREQADALVQTTGARIQAFKNPLGDSRHFNREYEQIVKRAEQLSKLNEVVQKTGITIVPTGALGFIVYADDSNTARRNFQQQSPKLLNKGAYAEVEAIGMGRSNIQRAAFEIARYEALDRLAWESLAGSRQSPGVDLIQYLDDKASTRSNNCRQENRTYYCEVRIAVPRIHLAPATLSGYQGYSRKGGSRRAALAGVDNKVKLSAEKRFDVEMKGKGGESFKFVFSVSQSGAERIVRLETIEVENSGSPRGWLFRFTINGYSAQLPYSLYEATGKPTVYSVSSMNRHIRVPASIATATAEVTGMQ